MISPEVLVKEKLCFLLALMAMAPAGLQGQEKSEASAAKPANPITVSEKGLYSFLSSAAVRAAEKMPEENYSFKPTPEVRSFGQLVGHVADANYMFCSQAAGEPNPGKNVEKSKTSKADLVAAIKDAVAYCVKTFDGMTDVSGSEMTKFRSFNMAKLTLLSLNTAHTDEHYGNMVTYMRLKGIVPPTSEGQPAPAPK
ncbi:DinB family protein [Acidobacteria bacterium AB60]|nr:DinB family protein [Acidobacteria bacterium AB60]